MSITTAITTQTQPNTTMGGAGLSGGGPPGGGGGMPGGGGQGGGGNAQPIAQPDKKPMDTLPMIFEGDCLKAKSFL